MAISSRLVTINWRFGISDFERKMLPGLPQDPWIRRARASATSVAIPSASGLDQGFSLGSRGCAFHYSQICQGMYPVKRTGGSHQDIEVLDQQTFRV